MQVAELGDKNDTHLTPKKLAAFYKSVGGDYDCTSVACGQTGTALHMLTRRNSLIPGDASHNHLLHVASDGLPT